MEDLGVADWAERTRAAVRGLDDLIAQVDELASVRLIGSPDARVTCLRRLWRDLRLNDRLPEATWQRTEDLRNEAVRGAEVLATAIGRLLRKLEIGLAAAVTEGGVSADEDLVRTADFGRVHVLRHQRFVYPLAAGVVASLPTGHRLRAVLAPEEFYDAGGGPLLVLGPEQRDGRPRAWYSAGDAKRLTADLRDEQLAPLRRERQEAEERRLAREAEEARNPTRQLAALQTRVQELEAKLAGGGT